MKMKQRKTGRNIRRLEEELKKGQYGERLQTINSNIIECKKNRLFEKAET